MTQCMVDAEPASQTEAQHQSSTMNVSYLVGNKLKVIGKRINMLLSPNASALNTSIPVLIPLSRYTSSPPPIELTAFITDGKTSIVADTPSTDLHKITQVISMSNNYNICTSVMTS